MVVVWTPPGGRERRCVFHSECSIGRDPDNRVIVAAATASRFHARLLLTARGLVLENLSSANPVSVNGDLAVPPGAQASLAQGDQFRVGPQDFRVAELSWVAPKVRCVNPTCCHEVPATQRDCPWCGTSLAFAQTQLDPRT